MAKVNILEERQGYMKIEINEDIGLLNAIVEKMWGIDGIESAAVVREHPYMEKPKIVVKGKGIKQALRKAMSEVEKEAKEFARIV